MPLQHPPQFSSALHLFSRGPVHLCGVRCVPRHVVAAAVMPCDAVRRGTMPSLLHPALRPLSPHPSQGSRPPRPHQQPLGTGDAGPRHYRDSLVAAHFVDAGAARAGAGGVGEGHVGGQALRQAAGQGLEVRLCGGGCKVTKLGAGCKSGNQGTASRSIRRCKARAWVSGVAESSRVKY
mgnify:CR=1 FL=1